MNINEAIETIKSNWPDEKYSMLREALTTLIDSPDAIGRECAEAALKYCEPLFPCGREGTHAKGLEAAIINAGKNKDA